MMLTMTDLIDVIVPRGGRSLIERVQRESRIPVIAHLEGICHVYIDRAADLEKARRIAESLKLGFAFHSPTPEVWADLPPRAIPLTTIKAG